MAGGKRDRKAENNLCSEAADLGHFSLSSLVFFFSLLFLSLFFFLSNVVR